MGRLLTAQLLSLALVAAGAAPAAPPCPADGPTASEACAREATGQQADTASLLQQPKRVEPGTAPGRARRGQALAERPPKKAVTFQGGGFRSVSVFTGVTAGLLRAGHLSVLGLFKKYDTVVGASGGMWYAGQLVYSQKFRKLQEHLATIKPCVVGLMFGAKWVLPWAVRLATLLLGLLPSGDDCFPAFDWQSFNAALHSSTASISETATLGGPAQAWAVGKLLLPVTAVMLPGSGVLQATNASSAFLFGSEQSIISYSGPGAAAGFLPARLSVRVGAGQDAAAELQFCGAEACAGARLAFAAREGGAEQRARTPPLAEVFNLAFRNSGRVPVVAALAASSATFFDTLLSAPSVCRQTVASVLNAVPVVQAPAARTFAEARKQVEALFEQPDGARAAFALETMAPAGFNGLVDAGAADNDGVLTAVASGAEVVTAFLFNANDLINLFQGGSPGGFFPGGFPFQYFQIFAETTAFAKRAIRGFKCLDVVPSSLVNDFCFGTIKATTVDNPVAGVVVGRAVTINVILVTTDVPNLPALDPSNPLANLDYTNYSRLTGDIAEVMAATGNQRKVLTLLGQFFTR